MDIADDVLAATRALAREQGTTMGAVISDLARKGLRKPASGGTREGVPLLTTRDAQTRVTLEMVNALRDEAP